MLKLLLPSSNHITQHWYDMFNSYINIILDKPKKEKQIKDSDLTKEEKKDALQKYRKGLTRLKKDIYNWEDKCEKVYVIWKKAIRNVWLKTFDKTSSVGTQIQKDPLNYLQMFAKMSYSVERQDKKPINCFPLRKSAIPQYIPFDTVTILRVLGAK